MAQLKHTYSDGISHQRIIIFGITPPPLGGVSIHIDRVRSKLKKQKNRVVGINNESRVRHHLFLLYTFWVFFKCMLHRPHHVYMHSLFLPNALHELRLLVWLKKMYHFRLTLVEHNCRHIYQRNDCWKQAARYLLSQVDHHVYIGTSTRDSFIANGMNVAQHFSTEAAFLPPDVSNEKKIKSAYPKDLTPFMQRHTYILLANASGVRLHKGGDLYGFDQLVAAVYILRQEGIDVGLIYALATIDHRERFNHYLQLIKQNNLTSHIYMLTGQKVLWPLLKQVDLFVRPTLSDGESVSVQEALWCATPVVASDVCPRPQSVRIFKTGDVADLARVIKDALNAHGMQSRNTTSDQCAT